MNRQFFMLLLFSIAVILFAALTTANSGDQKQAVEQPGSSMPSVSGKAEKAEGDGTSPEVIAYYFHTTRRCISCRKIEEYSREAIESGFAEELKKGTLEFLSINIDEPENKHFIKDYRLYTKSLIISDMENGKQKEWKNLTEIWKLLRTKDRFFKYVQNEISSYLKEN